MSSHWPGSCQSKPNLTNPVVIQPDSGLPWTAQPARFLCQQLRAALCLRTSPSHHSQKTQSSESMSPQSQFSPQARSTSPHSLFCPCQVCCVHLWSPVMKGVWVEHLEIRREIKLLLFTSKVVCMCVREHVCHFAWVTINMMKNNKKNCPETTSVCSDAGV